MNYIEFLVEEKKGVAKIHLNGKVRTIKNQKNVSKLKEIVSDYGYEIYKRGKVDKYIEDITNKYLAYIDAKNNKKLSIIGNIKPNMKISRNNILKNKKVVASTLAAVLAVSTFSQIMDSNQNINYKEITHDIEVEEVIDTENKSKELDEMLADNSFHLSFEDRSNSESIKNAETYKDLFQKYGEKYGVDYRLLMAIAAQESSGNHDKHINSGPACGIMQIEKSVYTNHSVRAYNFETGEEEKIHVTEEKLKDLETNIEIGTMIFRTCLESNNYNIPLALQSYNFGLGNMNSVLSACCENEKIDKEELIDDPTNNIWLKYRDNAYGGDKKYPEHVCSYIPQNCEITVKKQDNSPVKIIFTNEKEKINTM